MFNESIQSNYRKSYDDWYSDRKLVTDTIYQIDIVSAQSVKSPKYLIAFHQTAARLNAPNKNTNVSVFEHLDVKIYFVEIDRYRYPRESVLTNYALNDYLDQYKAVKLIFKEYVCEELKNPFTSYPDMGNKYLF